MNAPPRLGGSANPRRPLKETNAMVVGEAWELAIMFVLVLGNLALLVLLQRWFGLT
jgi:hypothetical protein